jgi:hypothetical protein
MLAKQVYQLTDGHDVFQTAEMLPWEVKEKNAIAAQHTDFNIRWQPATPEFQLTLLLDSQPVGQPMDFFEAQRWQHILKRNLPGNKITWRKQ